MQTGLCVCVIWHQNRTHHLMLLTVKSKRGCSLPFSPKWYTKKKAYVSYIKILTPLSSPWSSCHSNQCTGVLMLFLHAAQDEGPAGPEFWITTPTFTEPLPFPLDLLYPWRLIWINCSGSIVVSYTCAERKQIKEGTVGAKPNTFWEKLLGVSTMP